MFCRQSSSKNYLLVYADKIHFQKNTLPKQCIVAEVVLKLCAVFVLAK